MPRPDVQRIDALVDGLYVGLLPEGGPVAVQGLGLLWLIHSEE
jgi:hypothetical protein